MAVVRYEWCVLERNAEHGQVQKNFLKSAVGTPGKLTVTTTATVSGSRPVAPAGAEFIRIYAREGTVIVSWGADPTASQTNGIVWPEGFIDVIPVTPGMMFSFVEFVP